MSRPLRRGLLIVGGLVLVLIVAGRVLLTGGYARGVVASKLSAALGLPVEVTSLSVGRSSSTVGLQVGEFLTVQSATLDAPLTSLARGDTGSGPLTLAGVRVQLQVSADGKVLTPLPKGGKSGGDTKLPPVHIRDATLVINQDGRPPFTLANVSGDLTADGQLTAKADDPNWGSWQATGTIDLATKNVRIELANPNAPLRLDLLKSVPWVPPETWEQVHPSGTAGTTVTLDYTDATDDFRYGVVLTPRGIGLGLPELNVTLADVGGTVRLAGPVATLEEVTAKLADGSLGVSGKLDFGPDPSVLTFKAQAQGVDVQKLPAEWNLPKQFGGKLRGTADLTVLVHPGGRVETRGDGRGDLEGATVAGLPAEIKLRLRGDGKRFRFEETSEPAKPAASLSPPATGIPSPRDLLSPPPLWGRARVGGNFQPPHSLVVQRDTSTPHPNPPPQGGREPNLVAAAWLLAVLLQPPAAAAPPSTFAASVTLRDVDIAELLKRLEVKLDYKLAGKVTVVAKVAVPVGGDAPEKNTTVRGTFTSKQLTFEGLTAADVAAELVYSNGVLTLSSLKGAIDRGTLTGTATAAVNPRGDVTAKLTLNAVPLGDVLKAVPGGPFPVSGPVSGVAEFKSPLDKLTDTGTWQASGELTSPAIVAAGRTVSGVKLPLRVKDGKASLVAAMASVEGIPLTADAGVTLSGQLPFTAAVRSDPQQAAALTKLVPELTLPVPIEGKLAATAKASGTLSPLGVKADGTLAASELKVGPGTADAVSAKWALTPERVTVSDLDAAVFKGKITGSAEVPLDAKQAGQFQVSFVDVDAAGAASVIPNAPVRLTGRVSGKVVGRIPGGGQPTTAELDLSAPRLTVQGIPAEKLEGKVKVVPGGIEYKLTGKTLGGDLELEGRYPGGDKPADAPGKLSLKGADLGRLGQTLRSVAPLGGRIDLTATFAGDFRSGGGQLAFRELSWDGQEVSPEVRGRLAIRNGQLELDDLTGEMGGGRLRGRGRLTLADPARNFFRIGLDGANGKALLAPFGGGDLLDGEAAADIKLRVFPDVRGTAEVSIPRGKLAGLDVSGLRLPVEFDAAGGGRFSTRNATTTVGDGRAEVDVTYDVIGGRLGGQVRFRDVRVSRLGGPQSLFGGGRLTGRFDLSGENVRTANDITGRLVGTIQQANVRELPVLNVIAPFLNPRALAKPFDKGDIQGRLRGGVFRLERLALTNDQADLFADGTITLQRRLDLRVVARTGNLSGGAGTLRAFGLRIPAIGPIPVSLILDVSEFLSNLTVRLNVTGTTNQPVVRVNTSALLAEEAVRFFLTKYLPTAAALRSTVPNGQP